ncbi:hypothetical protein HYZ64_02265 [Candidatus Berkelbacteria bacterium]|nr:hypothetical protein [Candidatus Berkelbacteria bacterium]
MAYVKIVVAVPVTGADKIRQVANEVGASRQGNYDFSSGSVRQIGRFRPLAGAKPAVGKIGKIEEVAEERIEFICDKKIYKKVVQALKRAHPYEEPGIDVSPLLYP